MWPVDAQHEQHARGRADGGGLRRAGSQRSRFCGSHRRAEAGAAGPQDGDLAEYGVPFSLELSPKATFKKLSEAMGEGGLQGVIVYDEPNVAIGVSTVPAKLRTLAQMKADEKAAHGSTFLKEEADLLVYDQTNGGAKKEFGFTVRLEVNKVVYRCKSYLSSGYTGESQSDTVEKLEASIAACRSLKPGK
ncbi:MAG: hypothetical protein IPG04_10155 [Polyangiaceae bacterium]|nr:hypothetical protein [Polyangiaceae bacterium]